MYCTTGRSIFCLTLVVPAAIMLVACNRVEPRSPGASESSNARRAELVQSASLDLDKQKYIWAIEHTTFELETKFGKAVLAAMRQQNTEDLSERLFLPGCTGLVLDPSQRVVTDRTYLREASSPAEAATELAVDAAGLANYLCRYYDGFEQVDSAKCRVLALDADNRSPESGRWTAKLLISGAGKDAAGALLEFTSQHRVSCEFSDDAGIAAGKIVSRWTVLSEKTRHAAGPLFQEVTEAAGLNQVDIQDNWNCSTETVRQYHTQMAVEDYNRDGFLDIAVASANGRWRLLSSVEGKRFIDVTASVKLPRSAAEEPRSVSVRGDIYLASWIDFDNDGYPDLLLGDRLFHNLKGYRFEDVTDYSGLVLERNPRGCVVADYDCDGLLDLYILYQHAGNMPTAASAGWVGDDDSGAENQLWRNVGRGRFINVTEHARAGGGKRQTFAAAWLHANADHYPDLYIANDFGENVLLMNQGNGQFDDVSQVVGVADYATSMGVATGDVTGDGEPDIYVANMFSKMGRRIIAHVSANDYPPGIFEQIRGSCAGNSLYTRVGSQGGYQEVSEMLDVNQVGWAYAPALADFDLDGRLDIYATAGFLSFQRSKPDG